jgi:hypothetical protein
MYEQGDEGDVGEELTKRVDMFGTPVGKSQSIRTHHDFA